MTQKYNSLSFPAERLREFYDYDPETGYLISKRRNWAGRPVKGVLNNSKSGAWVIMLYREDGTKLNTNYGRVVFCWHHGRWPDGEIDHIDRNPRNNKIENLREADRVLQSQNTWKFNYGAYWNKSCNKWQASIKIHGKNKGLGLYETQKEAQEAYMRACDEIGREYLPPVLVDVVYVPAERVMDIR
jgi:hypothetical protein